MTVLSVGHLLDRELVWKMMGSCREESWRRAQTHEHVCACLFNSDCLNWSIKGPIDVIVGKVKHKAFKHRIRAKSESY